MNKINGEIELERKIKQRSTVFCPLARGLCVANCECLVTNLAKNHTEGGENKYTAIVYCGNYMFAEP